MIDLTPLEVRKKKGDFRRAMRGYEPSLVDDFLDLVADRLEELVRENMALHERLKTSDMQVGDYRDRERALTEALVSAQELREEMRAQAVRETELARRGAEQDAERILATAMLQREKEEEAIRRLRARQAQLLQTYRSFLEREINELGVVAETLSLRGELDDAAEASHMAAREAAQAIAPERTRTRSAPAPRASRPAQQRTPKQPPRPEPEPEPEEEVEPEEVLIAEVVELTITDEPADAELELLLEDAVEEERPRRDDEGGTEQQRTWLPRLIEEEP